MTTETDTPDTPETPEATDTPETPEASGPPESAPVTGFAALGLSGKLLEALDQLGYEEPTPIQRESIPPLLEGRDVIGQAATGTGKTGAFALPLVQRLSVLDREKHPAQPSALILVPTRELAMQVAEAVHRYGRALGVTVLPVYGGAAFGQQVRSLDRGVDVVVATPGRVLDHIRRDTIDLAGIASVILDEADEMLDMGFADDLEAILKEVPGGRQTVLFSATLPPRIAGIAKRHLRDPVKIQIAKEKTKAGATPKVRQTAYIVPRAYKLVALGRILDVENPTAALVFCRTRVQVDELTEKLSARGYRAQPLHGGISQEHRSRVIKQIKAGESDLVIATDVAARGLDIDQLTHVVNYDVPSNAESYVHRIGRVGRAGREGVAITLADPRESRLLRIFEQAAKHKIELAQVPTVADLRAKRLQLTRAALEEALLADDLDHFRVVVESLAQEHDLMNVALAAAKLIHQQLGADDDEVEEIPTGPAARSRPPRDAGPRGGFAGPGGYADRGPRSATGPRPRAGAPGPGPKGRPGGNPGMVRLFIGAGRNFGIRPQDIVGAIAGEAGVPGRAVGAIDIADTFSIVEVPQEAASHIVTALRKSTLKGKKVPVRPDRHT